MTIRSRIGMRSGLKRGVALGASIALAAALTACGPDDSLNSLGPIAGSAWPWDSQALAGGGYDAMPPMPYAEPMTYDPGMQPAAYTRGYGYAPQYYDSYADDYYRPQPAYYESDPGTDSYAMLALAATLGAVLGNSPPDYAFRYGDVEPWVWRTGGGYYRYAEPVRGGYRYYYYAPDEPSPFLVRDPYYSYGYRDSRLVAIYDRDGRVLDPARAWRQRRIGDTYFERSRYLREGMLAHQHFGVPAPLWARQRGHFEHAQERWNRARSERPAWQAWDRRHDPVITARWTQERAVRRYAADRFATWRKADYRGNTPRFYQEAAHDEALLRDVRARQSRLYDRARREQRVVRTDSRPSPRFDRGNSRQDARRRQQARQLVADRRQAMMRQAAYRQEQRRGPRTVRGSGTVQARQQARRQQDVQRRRVEANRKQAMRGQQARAVRQAQAHRRDLARQNQLRQSRATARHQAQARQQQARAQQQRAARAHQAQARQQQARAQQQRAARARQAQARQQQARAQQQRQRATQARQQHMADVRGRRGSGGSGQRHGH